jgi:hypothetical protein
MLDVGIIVPMEDFKWTSPMVVQPKKTNYIQIYVDLRSLNAVCVHDPFPKPFRDEVLENVGGRDSYSFTDGFSRYHQVQIIEEDQAKTTFVTEWGSFAYMIMSFGLKNTPAIFFG